MMAKFVYVCLFIVLTYVGNEGGVAADTPPDNGKAVPENTTPIPDGSIWGANDTNSTSVTPSNVTTATPGSTTTTNVTTSTIETTSVQPINTSTPEPPSNMTTMEPNSTVTVPSNMTSTTVTTPKPTTPTPSKAPVTSHFSVGSFFGGIFLGVVVALCCFFLLRWYINKRKANPYRTV